MSRLAPAVGAAGCPTEAASHRAIGSASFSLSFLGKKEVSKFKIQMPRGQKENRVYLEGGVFNKVEFLGTEAMGGGHGDMRNAGGLHAKIMRNQKVKAPTQGQQLAFEDFVKQDQAAKVAAEACKRPDSNKVKQMIGPGKLAPRVDTGGGRKARMVVGVRVRPLSAREARKGNSDVLEVKGGQEVYAYDPDDKMGGLDYLRLNVSKDKAYTFDHAFGPSCSSADVYNNTMLGVVSAVMRGFHGSCFAYGATGSGKTYTMAGTQESPGVMPRAINDLFKIARASDEMTWKFSLTYVEIYNERIKDLLNPGQGDLDVRECPKRGNVVTGAVEVGVTSLQEIMELMHKGTLFRTTESTNCNEVSSRSHAVLQINCVGVERYKDQRSAKRQEARLSMIDLAGSERAYKTDNTGQRLREGRNINRSLLSLANCINALADKTKKISHVPYRDSKLTRLLRDSLSGTSVSAMICAVSPSSDQFEETLNTLKYANRAKQMTPPSAPQRNVRDNNPVADKVEVLKELKESLLPMMKQLSTPKLQPDNNKGKPVGQDNDNGRLSRDESAERRMGEPENHVQNRPPVRCGLAGRTAEEEDEVVSNQPRPHQRRLSAAAEEAALAAAAAGAGNATANMAEVRKALEEVCNAEPETRSNSAVQAAYVALDSMEAEEVETISAESALLFREQQDLIREIARSKFALELAVVRLAWYDAAHDLGEGVDALGEQNVGEEDLEALQTRRIDEEANLHRLRQELTDNKMTISALQAEIPCRIVSASRLSLLKLVMRHQQAAADRLRFKQQARSAAGLMVEVLQTWQSAIPEVLSRLLLDVLDLPAPAKTCASIDTQRKLSLDSSRMDMPSPPSNQRVNSNEHMHRTLLPDLPRSNDCNLCDDDDEEELHVLDGGGVATPWRTLGSLARKATSTVTEAGAEQNDVEPGTDVVRKAHAVLKDARTRRLSVMKFVEEAATPKPRRSRLLATNAVSKAANNGVCCGAPESLTLPASPCVDDRRTTRSTVAGNMSQYLSDLTEELPPRFKPVRRMRSRPSSARSSGIDAGECRQ